MDNHLNSKEKLKDERKSFLSNISKLKQNGSDAKKNELTTYLILKEKVDDLYQQLKEVKIQLLDESKKRKQISSQLESFLSEIIEVKDFWEGVFGFASEKKSIMDKELRDLIEGFQQGLDILDKKLLEIGVKAYEPKKGEPFIPGKHLCLGTEECSKLPDGVIYEIAKKGYTWYDRLMNLKKKIRSATVITVKNKKGDIKNGLYRN